MPEKEITVTLVKSEYDSILNHLFRQFFPSRTDLEVDNEELYYAFHAFKRKRSLLLEYDDVVNKR